MAVIHITKDNIEEIEQGLCLLDFWAPWCGPCNMMEPILEKVAKLRKGKLRVLKINVEENPDIADKFDIMGVPTFVVLEDGREIKRAIGAKHYKDMVDLVY